MAENAIDGTDWPVTSPKARSEILLELKVDLRRLEERRRQSAANTADDAAIAYDLASCVRAYARLGEVDAGVPLAKQLFSIVTGDQGSHNSTKPKHRTISECSPISVSTTTGLTRPCLWSPWPTVGTWITSRPMRISTCPPWAASPKSVQAEANIRWPSPSSTRYLWTLDQQPGRDRRAGDQVSWRLNVGSIDGC